MSYKVVIRCKFGHRQEIRYGDSFTRDEVERHAGLMDGSSPLYAYPPGSDSIIGKCEICRAHSKALVPIVCEIQEHQL